MHPRRLALLLMLFSSLALAPATALAGGGGNISACAGFATSPTVIMRDSCFEGIAHFAEAGATLEIRNEGQIPHSFTAIDGSFDTGSLEAGRSAKIELAEAGVYQVYCILHGTASGQGMAGVLLVGDPAVEVSGASFQAAALTQQNEALFAAIEAQNATLTDLSTDLAAVRASVEAKAAEAKPEPAAQSATTLGLLGTVLGGSALALAFFRRRPGELVQGSVTLPPGE